jgi:FlaA1/EpsC-like NDP-sugar epimerase
LSEEGASIGSALAEVLCSLKPQRLLMVDSSEQNLLELECELPHSHGASDKELLFDFGCVRSNDVLFKKIRSVDKSIRLRTETR